MKRRGFLGMLGAVLTAPAMPAMAFASAPAGAFEAAVLHAQKFPVISVGGLAKRGGLTVPQAEAMIKELAAKDMVKLVGPARNGGVRAASKILTHDPWGLGRTSQPQQNAVETQSKQSQSRTHGTQTQTTDVALWLAHVRQICVDRGMTLHPRCIAGVPA